MSIHELQARLKALDEARHKRKEATTHEAFSAWDKAAFNAQQELEAAARRVAEGAGEPVAWQMRSRPQSREGWSWWCDFDSQAHMDAARQVWEYRGLYIQARVLYTTPPSADALVEAIQTALVDHGEQGCAGCTAVDAALAKHKEDTDGR